MSLFEPTELEIAWQAASAEYTAALKAAGISLLVGFGIGILLLFYVPLAGLLVVLATSVISSLITRKPKKKFYAAHQARMAELTGERRVLELRLARFVNAYTKH